MNPSPISLLDDLLLIICQPAFFMIGLFNIIVAVGTWDDPDPRKAGLEVSLFTNIMMVLTFLFLILDIQAYEIQFYCSFFKLRFKHL